MPPKKISKKAQAEKRMINFYNTLELPEKHNPYYDTHKLKVIFRAIICTASGGGKTNLLMNILYQMSDTFYQIIIITKEREPLYDMLQERLGDQVKIFYEGKIPPLPALGDNEAGIVIFDDMVLSQSKDIGEIFIRCRKQHYSAIFITQSYFGTNKIIRQNVNYLWLGKGVLDRDLNTILSEYSIRMEKKKLKFLYETVTKEKMHFLMIDTDDHTIRKDITDIICEY
jgi:hypothetical protein